jgi:hypothetical protein
VFLFGKNKNNAPRKKEPQKRNAYRANVEFPVRYTVANSFKRGAKANDLSTGGMKLVATEELPVGTLLDFTFTLPSAVLSVLTTKETVMEPSPFGRPPRAVEKITAPRPFDEMRVVGKVVSLSTKNRTLAYGIAFTDIEPFVREEIGRFIHAAQLYAIRIKREQDAKNEGLPPPGQGAGRR